MSWGLSCAEGWGDCVVREVLGAGTDVSSVVFAWGPAFHGRWE